MTAAHCPGPLTEAAVWHDGTGATPEWCLDKLEVTELSTGTTYYFLARKWLSTVGVERLALV